MAIAVIGVRRRRAATTATFAPKVGSGRRLTLIINFPARAVFQCCLRTHVRVGSGRFEQLSVAAMGAAAWYRRAADQGHADAQDDLSTFFRMGLGVPQSPVAAARWSLAAAEQGHTLAQHNCSLVRRGLGRAAEFCRGPQVDEPRRRRGGPWRPRASRLRSGPPKLAVRLRSAPLRLPASLASAGASD